MLHSMLNDMFHMQLPILEKLLRPIIVYLVLVILLRLFGKRELAQLNPFGRRGLELRLQGSQLTEGVVGFFAR